MRRQAIHSSQFESDVINDLPPNREVCHDRREIARRDGMRVACCVLGSFVDQVGRFPLHTRTMPLPRMIRRTCLCIHATPAQPGWSVFCRHVSRFLFGLATLSPCFPSPLMFSFWVFLFNSSWSCLFPLVGKPSQAKSELDSPCGVSFAFFLSSTIN